MPKRKIGLDKAKESKSNTSSHIEFDSNEEAKARIKSAVQKIIEQYGLPDTSKMEKKLYFIDPNKYKGLD